MISFEEHIQGDKPVLVDFYAEWCGPCKYMSPVLQTVKQAMGDKAVILKIDIDKAPAIANRYQVQAVPTLLLFQQGKILWRKSGVTPAQEVLSQITRHVP